MNSFQALHDSAKRARLLDEALQLSDVDNREGALYDLANELRREFLFAAALGVLEHITAGYTADRISLSARIALDLHNLGSTHAALELLRSLETLIDRCDFATAPGAILDLVRAHTSLRTLEDAERLLVRLETLLSLDVRREDTQLWVDTQKDKAQAARAWAIIGQATRAEALLQRVALDPVREHAALSLRAISAARDSSENS